VIKASAGTPSICVMSRGSLFQLNLARNYARTTATYMARPDFNLTAPDPSRQLLEQIHSALCSPGALLFPLQPLLVTTYPSIMAVELPAFANTPVDDIPKLVDKVRATFFTQKTKPIEFRLKQLRKLYWGCAPLPPVHISHTDKDDI
jgi:hypothetical protein